MHDDVQEIEFMHEGKRFRARIYWELAYWVCEIEEIHPEFGAQPIARVCSIEKPQGEPLTYLGALVEQYSYESAQPPENTEPTLTTSA
ncbi:MAG: hypothetical protein QXT00_02225 [Ignisphaera sp.]